MVLRESIECPHESSGREFCLSSVYRAYIHKTTKIIDIHEDTLSLHHRSDFIFTCPFQKYAATNLSC